MICDLKLTSEAVSMVYKLVKTDEQQCMLMKTVLTVGLEWMTSGHVTVYMTK